MSNGMPGSKPAVTKARAKVQDAIETAASLNTSLQAPGKRPVPKGPLPGSSSSSLAASTASTTSAAALASATSSASGAAGTASAGGLAAVAAAGTDDYEGSKASAKSSRVLKDEERSMVADLDKWDTGVFALPSDASLDDSF